MERKSSTKAEGRPLMKMSCHTPRRGLDRILAAGDGSGGGDEVAMAAWGWGDEGDGSIEMVVVHGVELWWR
nr:hypothetical protein [Tanacetum cinerariifolium]